jgi:hypothetical protein
MWTKEISEQKSSWHQSKERQDVFLVVNLGIAYAEVLGSWCVWRTTNRLMNLSRGHTREGCRHNSRVSEEPLI